MVLTAVPCASRYSEDYGKTFKDITNLINNTFIRTEFGMAISPDNSGKVETPCLDPHPQPCPLTPTPNPTPKPSPLVPTPTPTIHP